jgi:hypothetical protein
VHKPTRVRSHQLQPVPQPPAPAPPRQTHRLAGGRRRPARLLSRRPLELVHGAVEADAVGDVRSRNLPRVAVGQPDVRQLVLVPVLQRLPAGRARSGSAGPQHCRRRARPSSRSAARPRARASLSCTPAACTGGALPKAPRLQRTPQLQPGRRGAPRGSSQLAAKGLLQLTALPLQACGLAFSATRPRQPRPA